MIQAFLVSHDIWRTGAACVFRGRGFPIVHLKPNMGICVGKAKSAPLLDKPETVLLAKETHGIQCRDAGFSGKPATLVASDQALPDA